MTGIGEGSAVLRAEISAFYAGFGQPAVLREAFRQCPLLVPLIGDDQLSTSRLGGIDWICVFTGIEEYARYLAARGVESEREYRYQSLFGWRVAEYAASRPEPTGVAVDITGAAPMAFPPEVADAEDKA